MIIQYKTFYMSKSIIQIVLSIIFLSSCNNSDNSNEYTHHITHNKVHIKNNYIGKGGPIILLDNKLIGIDFSMDTCFYILDTTNYNLTRFGTKGQGPMEFISPTSLQYLDKTTFGSYDIMSKKINEIKLLPNNVFEVEKYPKISEQLFSFRSIKINDNRFIKIGPYPRNMFLITDSLDKKINSIYEFPHKNSDERKIKNHLRAMAYQGKILSNPSRNKMIYTSSVGNIIHFYEIKDSSLNILKKIEIAYPDYITEEKGNGFGAPLKSKNIISYICTYTTDQFAYFLYSGKTIKEFINEGSMYYGDNLQIYDWKGNLIKNIKLDMPCQYFCISNDDKKMWAITENPDSNIIRYDLP